MIKTLMGSIRDYMKVTVATPLLVLGEVLCEMLIPFITANLIDAIKDGATVAEMLPTAGFLVLIALTSLAFGAAAGVTCSHASCGFAKNLRHDLFYKIQTFSFANIDEFSSSSLVTRLTTDINNVQQAFMMIIRIAVRAPLVLIFAFTMAFIMGGSVAMVYLVIIPLLGFGLFFIIFKVRPIFSRVFHKYDALNESVEENVTGMRVVKSYVREDFEKEKFATAARDVQMDFTRAEKLLAFNNPMMNICVNGAFVVIIYLGSKLIITSQGTLFDVGQLSSTFTYGFQILMSLMQLSMIFVMVTMADESAHRIAEVLAAEPTIANPAEPVLEVADGSIDFDHVSFKYSKHAKRQALDDIDLHITSGETIGIIGGTGSAKSSLVQLLPRLYDVTEGSVSIGGVDVRRYDLETLRSAVANAENNLDVNRKELTVKAAQYRVWHSRVAGSAWLSQLELQAVLDRALRRARLPLAFSQGFHPMPLVSFGRALPVGVESAAEWFALTLHQNLPPEAVAAQLAPHLPLGMEVTAVERTTKQARTEQAVAEAFCCRLPTAAENREVAHCFAAFAALDSCPRSRETKKGPRTTDLRPLLARWDVAKGDGAVTFVADWGSAYLSPLKLCLAILEPLGEETSLQPRLHLCKTAQIFADGQTRP